MCQNILVESDEDKFSENTEIFDEEGNDNSPKRYSFEFNFAVILKKKSRKLPLKIRKRIVWVKTKAKTRKISRKRIKIRRKQMTKRNGKMNPYYV